MTPFIVLIAWLISLLIATYVGYDRGRWEAGLALGLVGGPLGAIAAGMLTPSVEAETERRYALDGQLKKLAQTDAARNRQRKREADTLADLANALEKQIEEQQRPFAEGLENLAHRLEEIAKVDPAREVTLRHWINWLTEKAEAARVREREIE